MNPREVEADIIAMIHRVAERTNLKCIETNWVSSICIRINVSTNKNELDAILKKNEDELTKFFMPGGSGLMSGDDTLYFTRSGFGKVLEQVDYAFYISGGKQF